MSGITVPEPAPGIDAPASEQPIGVSVAAGKFSVSNLRNVACSLADQVLAVGGMFAINIALARVRSKEEYGIFTLSYSLFTFLAGLHNAAILEAYTIYGSGRYYGEFTTYETFVRRNNARLLAGLSSALMLIWLALFWLHRGYASPALLGMAISCGILLSAAFARRTFYIQRRPDLAARFSAAFLLSCMLLLSLAIRGNLLNGLSAFLIVAAAWSIAFLSMPNRRKQRIFFCSTSDDPNPVFYWSEHWKYSRWVFVTALVFQFTTQAYFWVVAGLLTVRDVAGLRAMYNLALPVDQIFSAISLLVLPQMAFAFAAHDLPKLQKLWRQCSLAFFAISAGFALLVGFSGIRLLHVVYGSKFDEVAPLLRWYVLVPVVMGLGNAANAGLKAVEKPQAVFLAYLASGVTTFVLGIFLVARLGLRGAVYGMLLSAATYAGILVFSFRRIARSKITPLTVAESAVIP